MTSCQDKPPKVSIICPTYNRPERHENLYKAFLHQTYENKELLVLDDSPSPSPFFTNLDDPRVKYQNLSCRATIGYKRNALIGMASGEIIAHFDDDDYYAPNYLSTMVGQLGPADLIKLSKWLAWREIDASFWEWDTRFIGLFHFVVMGNEKSVLTTDLKQTNANDLNSWMDANLWGYGFSYVYRKSLWESCPFENINGGEDYNFVCKARNLGKKISHIPDLGHIAVHTLHPGSTSRIFPQYHHDSLTRIETVGEKAAPWLTMERSL